MYLFQNTYTKHRTWTVHCVYNKVLYVWDDEKRDWNLNERGLDFADAHLVYENPKKITFRSVRNEEERKLDLALVEVIGVVLVLVYLEQCGEIRVISFRQASRKERKTYAQFKEREE